MVLIVLDVLEYLIFKMFWSIMFNAEFMGIITLLLNSDFLRLSLLMFVFQSLSKCALYTFLLTLFMKEMR